MAPSHVSILAPCVVLNRRTGVLLSTSIDTAGRSTGSSSPAEPGSGIRKIRHNGQESSRLGANVRGVAAPHLDQDLGF